MWFLAVGGWGRAGRFPGGLGDGQRGAPRARRRGAPPPAWGRPRGPCWNCPGGLGSGGGRYWVVWGGVWGGCALAPLSVGLCRASVAFLGQQGRGHRGEKIPPVGRGAGEPTDGGVAAALTAALGPGTGAVSGRVKERRATTRKGRSRYPIGLFRIQSAGGPTGLPGRAIVLALDRHHRPPRRARGGDRWLRTAPRSESYAA